MTDLRRIRTVFTGVAGTPWYCNMYFTWVSSTEQAALDAVGDFWTAIISHINDAVTGTVEGDIPVVDDATGNIINMESATPETINFSGAGGITPPASQGLINTLTDTFIGGRRLRGKVYLPGIITGALGTNGAVAPANATIWNNAMAALVAASASPGPLRVYSPTHATSAVVTAHNVKSQFAVLRSRRD